MESRDAGRSGGISAGFCGAAEGKSYIVQNRGSSGPYEACSLQQMGWAWGCHLQNLARCLSPQSSFGGGVSRPSCVRSFVSSELGCGQKAWCMG
jgi:hypothetical protein